MSYRSEFHPTEKLACTINFMVLGSIPVGQHTFVSPSAFSRRAVVSYWRKYVHEVLVNRLGGLSLPRKSVVRLTDRPDMTLDVYRGRKTTIQPTNHQLYIKDGCNWWIACTLSTLLVMPRNNYTDKVCSIKFASRFLV